MWHARSVTKSTPDPVKRGSSRAVPFVYNGEAMGRSAGSRGHLRPTPVVAVSKEAMYEIFFPPKLVANERRPPADSLPCTRRLASLGLRRSLRHGAADLRHR